MTSLDALPAMPERDPLAMKMIAAWLNVRVEQLPLAYRVHTCPSSMDAWQRVALAARRHLADAASDAIISYCLTGGHCSAGDHAAIAFKAILDPALTPPPHRA